MSSGSGDRRGRSRIDGGGRRARRARSAGRPGPGASRRRRRRAGSRGRRRTGAARRPAAIRPVDPDVAGAVGTVTRRDLACRRSRAERTARLGDGLVPLRAPGRCRQVIPPPTWRLSRVPSATKVRMRMLVCHRAVRARSSPARRCTARAGRARAPQELHRPDLRGARDRAAGEGRGEQVERVAARRQPAGDRRDEVLDGRRPLEAAQARHADAARARQTRPRSLRSTSTIITFSARSLALARSSHASARSSARSRPRGRVPLIGSVVTRPVAIDRQERLGRGRQDGPRRAGLGRGRPRSR